MTTTAAPKEFRRLKANLSSKLAQVGSAEMHLRDICSGREAVNSILTDVLGRDFVLFCGAGVSISPPASAPGFENLRNAIVEGLAETLTDKGVLSFGQRDFARRLVSELKNRVDIVCPPEMIFSSLRDHLGTNVLTEILSCLKTGAPNCNHQAIRAFVQRADRKLAAVVTTNFDEYIECALDGITIDRYVRGGVPQGQGFALLKPHGTLSKPESILVTLDDLLFRLDDETIGRFEDTLSNRTIVVVGYSGWDYDIFPLLIHAGRHWNSTIVWLLWTTRDSMNRQVVKLQLALGEKCCILSADERAVLPEIAGLQGPRDREPDGNLVTAFKGVFAECPAWLIAAAFVRAADPMGLPEDIREQIFTFLWTQIDAGVCKTDEESLYFLHMLATHSDVPKTRAHAIASGVRFAHGAPAWLRQFSYLRSKKLEDEEDDDGGLSALSEIDFNLRENFFPQLGRMRDQEKAKRSLTLRTLVRKAELLWQTERAEEAEELASRLLCDYSFPESSIERDYWLHGDGTAEGDLRQLMAEVSFERGAFEDFERDACLALDIFWRDLDIFRIDGILDWLGSVVENSECAKSAWSLLSRMHMLAGDRYSELQALASKLRSGLREREDTARAAFLLAEIGNNMDPVERQELSEFLRLFR
jgi:hypothetical protein